MSEFLSIPIFDDDFYKMMFRFLLNISFLTIIIQWLYYSTVKKRDYLFTYYMIGIIVFFLCFTLKKYELDIGMALGLFAIFGIIRYRTNPIPIKEMTYLFIIIGVSVINSLANQKMSYAEIVGANVIVVITIFIIERLLFRENTRTKTITYEKIENIKPDMRDILIKDLEERTGLQIVEVEIGSIDFLKDTTSLTIKYLKNS
ncbi:MAG: DUF4956 domain-containing protein [Bacteroidia bacterium]|jgi:hypothetical protein|nr:DUF4956 domain-containing protein [Bacteroidia bacterium]